MSVLFSRKNNPHKEPSNHGSPEENTEFIGNCTIPMQELPESTLEPNHIEVENELLKLNVGGSHYCIPTSFVLKKGPDTLLYSFVNSSHEERLKTADAYFMDMDEYYFARSPRMFENVFNYYVSGALHMPADTCASMFKSELGFWKLDYGYVAECCCKHIIVDNDDKDFPQGKGTLRHLFEGVCCGDLRFVLWKFVEYPFTNIWSKLFMIASLSFVVISVLAVIMASIPDLQLELPYDPPVNDTITNDLKPERIQHPIFQHLEMVCVTWFTFELLLRFLVSPRMCEFWKQGLNIIDLLAIFPFYLELVLMLCDVTTTDLKDFKGAFLVVRVIRVLRVIRILKFARYFAGLRKFAVVIRYSVGQLSMTGMLVLVGLIFFSTLVYFVEKDHPDTPFPSIPAAMWWCLVTMTTVGYGDIVPVTVGGKLVGCCAIICGVFVLALPITIMVENFTKFMEEPEDET